MRAAACAAAGVPALAWDRTEAALAGFLAAHRPDALIGGIPRFHREIAAFGVDLPFAGLMTFADDWYGGVTGWVADQAHRGQVTLELIEQRLRYGPRTPRRIVVAPRWQEGASLGRRA